MLFFIQFLNLVFLLSFLILFFKDIFFIQYQYSDWCSFKFSLISVSFVWFLVTMYLNFIPLINSIQNLLKVLYQSLYRIIKSFQQIVRAILFFKHFFIYFLSVYRIFFPKILEYNRLISTNTTHHIFLSLQLLYTFNWYINTLFF